jgi:hypothetical protein
MGTSVVVTYTVKPEALAEHVRLIEAVFDQLRADRRSDVAYQVVRLSDGVSFVHVSTATTPDGTNPLPQLESFRDFSANLGSRVVAPPVPSPADLIGTYPSPWPETAGEE